MVTDGGGNATFSVSLPVASPGQTITATATDPAGNTSELSATTALADPFTVTTAEDSGVGSLRQAITAANAVPGPNTIRFLIPQSGPVVITLISALPLITDQVTIDGTTEPGYGGTPLVEINGIGQAFDGLDLAIGSDGSTIDGLDIADFGGVGINIQTNSNVIHSNFVGTGLSGSAAGPGNQVGILVSGSNNTIGGTVLGAANTIAFNTGAGVTVDTGTGNAIRTNAIFANNGGIVLENGANQNQPAPALVEAIPENGSTEVGGTLSGAAANSIFTLDFYASELGDPPGVDAHEYLGNATVVTDGTGTATFTVSLPVATALGQTVTATTTDPVRGTSEFSATESVLPDTTPPTSHVVNSLGTTQSTDSFPVSVTFSDPTGSGGAPASGVSSVDLYVSVNNGPFSLYQTLTFAPTASGTVTFTFAGQDRNLYAFHSVAHDAAGNTESKSSTAIEASTSVPDLNPPVTHILASNPSYSWGPFPSSNSAA